MVEQMYYQKWQRTEITDICIFFRKISKIVKMPLGYKIDVLTKC